MTETPMLDRVVDAFIDGRMDFARFRKAVEQQLSRHPELRDATLDRLEALREEGHLSVAIHAVIAQEIELGASEDHTSPIAEGEAGEPMRAVQAPDPARARSPEVTLPDPAAEPVPADDDEDEAGEGEFAPPAPSPGRASGRRPARRPSTRSPAAPLREPTLGPSPALEPRREPRLEPMLEAPRKPAQSAPAVQAPSWARAAPAVKTTGAEGAEGQPKIGTVLAGRYRLDALLGRGGMSLVYRAEDLRSALQGLGATKVAVKLLAPNYAAREDARMAIEREAGLLQGLNHAGVVKLLDFGRDGESAFLVMEMLSGERLRGRLARSYPAPLPTNQAMAIARELSEALAYLHRRRVVHRDVKPVNVYITLSGGIRLIDFGLAASIGRTDGRGGPAPLAWTPVYASPEMLAGAAPDLRDDVYSLGCVIYEMLAGHHPWRKLPGDEAARQKLPLSRPPRLPAARWKVLQRALAFRASDRPADAGEFLQAFFAPAKARSSARWAIAASIGALAAATALLVLERGVPQQDRTPSSELAPPVVAPRVPEDSRVTQDEDAPAETGSAAATPDESEPAGDTGAAARPGEALPTAADAPAAQAEDLAESADRGEGDEGAGTGRGPAERAEDQAPVETQAAPARETPPAATGQRAPAARPTARPASFALISSAFRVAESAGALRMVLFRPSGFEGPLRVEWRTLDGSALDGSDYAGSPMWQFAEAPRGVDSLVILIPIVDDSLPGQDRDFIVELREAEGGPRLGQPSRASVTIVDDD